MEKEIKQLVLTAEETAKYEAFAAKMQHAIDEAKANNDDKEWGTNLSAPDRFKI